MIVKKKEKNIKKVCFSTPEKLYLKYKELKKRANENGLEIEINAELQKVFEKLIIRAEKDFKKLISEKQSDSINDVNFEPEM